MKGQSRQPDCIKEDHSHDNDVRIGLGPRITKYFRIHLMELPESTFLRPFMPEHGADGEKLLYGIFFIEPVLNVSPDHRGGRLWTQAEVPPLDVFEGVHFLGNNVRILSDAPTE